MIELHLPLNNFDKFAPILTQKTKIMKKGILFIAVVFAASFASCKKDYSCKCTTGGVSVTGATQNETKKDADDRCELETTSYTTCEAVKAD